MNKVSLDFEHCYGIGKLKFEFDFLKSSVFLIYAPNGTMKTSLAKTFRYFTNATDKAPCDQIYPHRTSKYELRFDDTLITQNEERMLVIDPEVANYDASHAISNFIASKELKDQYDDIYKELESRKLEFIKKLKNVSKSSDCESEIIAAFREQIKDNFYDVLDKISPLLRSDHPMYEFKYNDIFDKKGNVKKFLEKHVDDLDAYIQNYELLLSKSGFFKKSTNSFGTYQATAILNSVEDGSFFEAGHSLDLQGDVKITSADEMRSVFESEVNKIVNDAQLKKIFEKVDKAIGSNAELRVFQKEIEKNNLLLVELKQYEDFKRKVWLGYLTEIKSEATELHDFYTSKKEELNILLQKSKEQQETWKNLIEQFGARFHVPFEVKLENQEDVILKKDLAVLSFSYSDRADEQPVTHDKDILFRDVLSRGERRVFYILQILFDIESRKLSPEQTLVIFDDIADSFDYLNKYAIIEYIKDLEASGKFKIIILTHNFDFYRTVAKRLDLARSRDFCAFFMAVRKRDGEITLNNGEYINDVFGQFLQRFVEEKIFISLIPFLRNIIEYTESVDSDEYAMLTKCLHIKTGSEQILVTDILKIWAERFPKHAATFLSIQYASRKVIELIYDVADKIVTEDTDDEINLENKIVLSIAIRLKAEQFMFANIPDVDMADVKSNQTQKFFKLYKKSTAADQAKIKVLDRVMLMTPENIHLNAFMYEPLIDMALWHLRDLYRDVKNL